MDNLESLQFNIATKTKLGSTQLKNTATINSLDNVKITKVLTSNAKPRIENVTVLNSKIKFDGVVDYELLAVMDNNDIVPLTQKSNFTYVFENSSITPETIVNIYGNLIELENVSNTGGEVVYSCSLNFDIYAIEQKPDIVCAKNIEGVFVKESEISLNLFVDKVVYDGTVNFDMPKDNKVSKILYVINQASLKSIIPANDYFVASGEIFSTVVYQSDDGQIKSIIKETSFSEEIEAKGVNKESNIQARVLTKEPIIVENSDKNMFNIEVPIQILAQVYNRNTINCIVDAYSLQNEVKLTTTSFEQGEFFPTRQTEENILTNFTLSNGMQEIHKILSVTPINVSIVNQLVKAGELILEGIANINIIYYFEDEEGNNVLNSLDVEVPYSLNINASDLQENDQVIANIVVADINVKSKKGKELEILASAKIDYDIIRNNIFALTTEISLGDLKPQKDYSLEIYLAKENQTLWDIAKELNISTAELMAQNGDLTLPISPGEKIVAYRQRKVDFD